MKKTRRIVALGALPLFLILTAQMEPAQSPAVETDEKKQMDILRGPDVPEDIERTLIRRDGMGRFIPLEERPEEAALVVADIDPARRQAAREIVAQRRTALGMHLVENVELVRDATDAVRAGDDSKVNALSRELYNLFDPDHERAPLLEPMSEALSPEESEAVRKLVDNYWEAWIDWELRAQMNPPAGARDEVQSRLAFTVFQQEIRRAYEWSLGPYQRKIQRICEVVEASDEQRAEIRAAIVDHIQKAKLQSTPEQRRELAQRIHNALTEEQRMKLFELIVIDLR